MNNLKMVPHNENLGDVMTKEHFLENVEVGGFIDYDGFGRPATETEYLDGMYDGFDISPSKVKKNVYPWPEWATHVVWYNR